MSGWPAATVGLVPHGGWLPQGRDCFDGLLARHLATHEDQVIFFNWLYAIWPEWPIKPFLSVPYSERQRHYRACRGTNKPRAMEMIPLRDIYRTVVGLKEGEIPGNENKFARFWRHGFAPVLNEDILVVKPMEEFADRSFYEIGAVKIDFLFPIKSCSANSAACSGTSENKRDTKIGSMTIGT